MAYEQETRSTPICDLDKLRKTAPSKRELAWELLKQTRNAQYVAMRYDFPLETMEKALAAIPAEKPIHSKLRERRTDSDSARTSHSRLKRASEFIPEATRTREPGEDDDLE